MVNYHPFTSSSQNVVQNQWGWFKKCGLQQIVQTGSSKRQWNRRWRGIQYRPVVQRSLVYRCVHSILDSWAVDLRVGNMNLLHIMNTCFTRSLFEPLNYNDTFYKYYVKCLVIHSAIYLLFHIWCPLSCSMLSVCSNNGNKSFALSIETHSSFGEICMKTETL